MSKNRKLQKAERKTKRELRLIRSARMGRKAFGSNTETAEPGIFFFSIGGLVMPLSTLG